MLIDRLDVTQTGAKHSVELMLQSIDEQLPLDEDNRYNIRLVSMELLNNIVDYSSADHIELSCGLENGVVSITIDDNGPGFNYDEIIGRDVTGNLEQERGRGIFIVRTLADEFRYNSSGNSVNVVLNLNR